MVLSVELKKPELTGLNTGMGPPRNRTGKVTEHCEPGEGAGPREMLQAEASHLQDLAVIILRKGKTSKEVRRLCEAVWGRDVQGSVCHVG